ncbi:hypothetical protein GGR55DRAFT_204908 [Xylaria sp. FL0064]|nr:hypothetical protein GGR55DRAFT_204908 [Xylaria sp. FL0064]
MGLTRDNIIGIGKDPNTAVPMNPVWGMLEDTYMRSIDGYYFRRRWGFEAPIMFVLHVEIIANTWSEAQPWPHADFAAIKQRRDLRALGIDRELRSHGCG